MAVSHSQFTVSKSGVPLVLPAGQSVDFNVSFTPTMGVTRGTVEFSSDASNPTLVLDVRGGGTTSVSLTASPSTVRFGPVAIGASSTVPVVLRNDRSWELTLRGARTTGSGFSVSGASFPLTLNPGQNVTLNVSFAPQSAGTVGGSLFVSRNWGRLREKVLTQTGISSGKSPHGKDVPISLTAFPTRVALTVPLTGTGAGTTPTVGSLTLAPTLVNFGNVKEGTTQTLPMTIRATGASVIVSSASSSSSQFVLQGASFPLTLASGQSLSFKVAFTPQSSGTVTGSLSFASDASDSQALASVTGSGTTPTAVGSLTLAPTLVSFGNVKEGTTQTLPMTIRATGASVTVSSASSSSSEFVLQGVSFPLTLASGQSLSFNVAFTPQSSGTVTGSLSFASDASDSQALASVTGSGTVTPTPFSVNLSWNESSGATGYNVYRSTTASGIYSKINSPLDTATSYTDSTVVSGQTYYYAATSVSSSGQESARSTPVEVVIP